MTIKFLKLCIYWILHLVGYASLILALGTIIGSVLFLLLGPLFVDNTYYFLLKKGSWLGFRYAGIWAGGIAIVLCFLKGARKKHVKN